MNGQTNIFECLYETYKINKPIRLIEFFAGYGSQALALKYLGVNFEHWKICEWAVKSIQAYKDIHFTNDNEDYSKMYSKDYLIEQLHYWGISNNYNEPMIKEQIKRLSEDKIRQIYNNIISTHNLVNIQQVKGCDLDIKETDKYEYMLTYSFPCQDLSNAGLKKGMSDTSTRSGMLWEVERILKELKELPQILVMENVPQVHGIENLKDFNKWQYELEKLGYKNYFQDLIATNYGIPQTRNRTFMISILGDYNYTFPKPIPLKLKLKDMLEENVDEKYYLSDTMLKYMMSESSGGLSRKEMFERNFDESKEIASTITTCAGNRASDNFIIDSDNTNCLKIKNNTKKGYLKATVGDGINISGRMEYQRGNVQKGMIQTLDCSGGESKGVVVSNLKKQLCNELIENNKVKEFDVIKHSYSKSRIKDWQNRNVEKNNESPTLDTRCDCLGVVVGTYQFAKSDNFMNGKNRFQKDKEVSDTLQTSPKEGVVYTEIEKKLFTKDGNIKRYINSDIVDEFKEGQMATTTYPNGYGHGPRTHDESISLNTIDKPSVKQNLRIRKLTPKECFRLMGVKDEDFEKCSKNQSNASLYHLAGDSIVVNILMAIFKELL